MHIKESEARGEKKGDTCHVFLTINLPVRLFRHFSRAFPALLGLQQLLSHPVKVDRKRPS